ncbi:serine--tRNA ligase [Candidatus Methanoperedens nitratireducens]|nr:serine--tRNA ligase [Candidatus Methanoperedens nitroreducens]
MIPQIRTIDEIMEPYFHLKGAFKTSADVSAACADIERFIEEAKATILQKGVPAGRGARIIGWDIKDNSIFFDIESDRYLRAHDAFIRLRKPLAGVLGKKYRIGIRGMEIEEFIVKLPSEQALRQHKIPYVREIDFKDGMITLTLDVGEAELEKKIPDRIISLIEDKIAAQSFGGKAEHWSLLWESPKKEMKFKGDPTIEAERRGWIKHGVGRGQWIHGPQMTQIFRTFEQIVLEEIIRPLGYIEMIFPKLVPWEVWKRSGHAKGIYPEIYYVCPPKTRDPAFWEEVMDYYKVTLEVPLNLIWEKIDKPLGGMAYAQCPSFWPFLQGKIIADDSLPIKVFDRSGTSHRYESGGIHGMERVDEFHRIELVFIGTPEQVLSHSKDMQECYKHVFNDILDLEWRMAWVTPWFMAQEGMIGLAGRDDVGTIDFEAPLPYRGKDGEWLEFQNLSVNGDKYPRGFNVKSQSAEDVWSGCSGIGLERWASVFLAQKGFEPEDWPDKFRDKIGEIPRGIRFM